MKQVKNMVSYCLGRLAGVFQLDHSLRDHTSGTHLSHLLNHGDIKKKGHFLSSKVPDFQNEAKYKTGLV